MNYVTTHSQLNTEHYDFKSSSLQHQTTIMCQVFTPETAEAVTEVPDKSGISCPNLTVIK